MGLPPTPTTPSPVGGFMSRQAKRPVPATIACFVILIWFSIAGTFGGFNTKPSYRQEIAAAHFPRKIWQTWKVDPLGFEERDLNNARSWLKKNPGHRYEVLTDQNDLYYVETHFGPGGLNRPDIVYMYRELTAKIVKADLLRYLVMYVEGGVYTDIDVEALRPIHKFIPDRFREKDIDMVIGVEVDQPEFSNHTILGSKSMSFCQWTFMCKPQLPVMMRLVDNIIKWLTDLSMKQGVPISELKLDFDDIISGTGPSAFTDAVLTEMGAKEKRWVTWDSFHALGESTVVGRVLVLTVEAFAAGQGHSDSGNHNARTALVKHHYHASKWPTNHPRYKHPVYGEVERCNWDADCVKQWDANKAAFDALPPEEQQKQISIKEAKDAADAAALANSIPPPLLLTSPLTNAQFPPAL